VRDLAPALHRQRPVEVVPVPATHASPSAPMSDLRPRFPCSGADLTAARACEQAVFGRRFGNTADELAAEYGPYEESTSFGAVFGADGGAVAAVRLVRPGPAGVKTLQDAAAPPWNVARRLIDEAVGETAGRARGLTWDVASFCVDSTAVGADRRVVMVLLAVMFGAFRDNGVTSFVAMLDSVARRPLGALGVRMLDLPGASPAPYLGSASTVPVYRRTADLHGEHAERFPQVHQQVFHGDCIDGLDARLVKPGSFALSPA
jgi:hypothetical protein